MSIPLVVFKGIAGSEGEEGVKMLCECLPNIEGSVKAFIVRLLRNERN